SRDPALESFLLLGHPINVMLPGMVVMLLGLTAYSLGYSVRVARIRLERVPALASPALSKKRIALLAVPVIAISTASIAVFLVSTGGWERMMAGVISNKLRGAVEGGDYRYTAFGYYRLGASLALFLFCCALIAGLRGGLLRSPAWL